MVSVVIMSVSQLRIAVGDSLCRLALSGPESLKEKFRNDPKSAFRDASQSQPFENACNTLWILSWLTGTDALDGYIGRQPLQR